MGRPIDITLDDEVYDGLVKYLEQEFGNTRAKSIIINKAVREFLERKGVLANPHKPLKEKPNQSRLFKE